MPRRPGELRLLSPRDAARELGCEVHEIERLILAGDLRGVAVTERGARPFRRLRLKVLESEVALLAAKRRVEATGDR